MSLENTFKALSDPTRREILNLLKEKNMTAGELAEKFDMTNATMSYHLQILVDAGLIFFEKEKNFRIYSLNASVFEELLNYILSFKKEDKNEK
jgi:ArsR family transcriptional regulator